MVLRTCINYDGMHMLAGCTKSILFVMMALLPLPNAAVLLYDEQVNGMPRSMMVLSE